MEKEHFEIVLEDINSKMSLVIEGQQILHNDFERLDKKIDTKVNELRDEMIVRFDYLEHKLDKIAEKHEQRIIKLETKVA